MDILVAASEMVPFAKTGGLADVAGALPPALAGLGERTSAIIPCYRGIEARFKPIPTGIKLDIPILMGEELVVQTGEILEARQPGFSVFLVKHDRFFNREALYGTIDGDYADNCARFTFFCRAVLEFLRLGGWKPNLIHCHDWQTALIPIYLKTIMADDPKLAGIKTALTIHNLGYQGKFWHWDMKVIGLPWDYFNLDFLEYYGNINLLKAGILSADAITTVSKGYAREIQTDEMGAGLTDVIRQRAANLHGILNGIDYRIWNPAIDRHLASTYTPDDLGGKAKCKAALQREMGLDPDPDAPLIGIISRLADQKGFDLIAAAFDDIMASRAQLAVLGTGERKYHELFTARSEKHQGRVGVRLGFDDGLAHRIEAGADLFLMPSLYEPCGLNQMISLKYGTVPVVRATGGLDDTITPWDPKSGRGNGFKFSPYSSEAMMKSLREALAAFARPEEWKKLVRNGMLDDHSWSASAREYQGLFAEITGGKIGKARPVREEKPTAALPPAEKLTALTVSEPPPALPAGAPAAPAAKPARQRKTKTEAAGTISSAPKSKTRKRAAAKPAAKKRVAKKPAPRGKESSTDQ